ncbi:hypothetical protein ZWY2020_057583 [Hordeum vulgare]|nr:hypothetical protein ZWY2020_057583 [Hordeum vulgare]
MLLVWEGCSVVDTSRVDKPRRLARGSGILQQQQVSNSDNQSPGYVKQDALSIELAEQQILLLARQQAQREEELGQSERHILALQQEIEDLERENRLHDQQEAMLKAELRNMERSQKREGIDVTYLKNVILKLLETGKLLSIV